MWWHVPDVVQGYRMSARLCTNTNNMVKAAKGLDVGVVAKHSESDSSRGHVVCCRGGNMVGLEV